MNGYYGKIIEKKFSKKIQGLDTDFNVTNVNPPRRVRAKTVFDIDMWAKDGWKKEKREYEISTNTSYVRDEYIFQFTFGAVDNEYKTLQKMDTNTFKRMSVTLGEKDWKKYLNEVYEISKKEIDYMLKNEKIEDKKKSTFLTKLKSKLLGEGLYEGGNATVGDVSADRIDLKKINRPKLKSKLVDLCQSINKHSRFKIWDTGNIDIYLNGSSSFVLSDEYTDKQILSVKPSMGDIDIMVGNQFKDVLINTLEKTKDFDGVRYVGGKMNMSNTQFNSIFELAVDEYQVYAQVDFEFVELEDGKPSEFHKFAHSSTFEDMSHGIKGLHHKLLLRALARAASMLPNVLIATDTSTPENVKITKNKLHSNPAIYKFSVDRGMRTNAYVPMLDNDGNQIFVDGKPVYKATKANDSDYIRNVRVISEMLFGEYTADINTFVGLVKQLKKQPLVVRTTVASVYYNLLWGDNGQHSYPDNDEDFAVKYPAWTYFCEMLGIQNKIKSIDDVKGFYKK